MAPVLFSFGPIVIQTLNVFLVISLLAGLFVFWRKGREEHYDEMMLFDGILVSLVFGFFISRIAFIIERWSVFGLNPLRWLDVATYGGFIFFFMLVGSAGYLTRYAKKVKWDHFEILDFWALAVACSTIVIWLGYFFAGIGFGTPTSMPWGIVFPGVFEKHHPLQLYAAVFYTIVFAYLMWAERNYRMFTWYRSGKKTAQTGFVFSVFVIASGIFWTVASSISLPSLVVLGVRLDTISSAVLILVGAVLLYVRSGRSLPSLRKPKKKPAVTLEEFSV